MAFLRLRVYISHASEDTDEARDLYRRLKRDGLEPWLYEENNRPGDDWEALIKKQLRRADIILLCRSPHRKESQPTLQWETDLALKSATPKVTVKLAPTVVPKSLSSNQWVGYYNPGEYDRLRDKLKRDQTRKRLRWVGNSAVLLLVLAAAYGFERSRMNKAVPTISEQPAVGYVDGPIAGSIRSLNWSTIYTATFTAMMC